MKECIGCSKTLGLEAFAPRNDGGRRNVCRPCHRTQCRNLRKQKPNPVKEGLYECKMCGDIKSHEHYTPDVAMANGIKNRCKPCLAMRKRTGRYKMTWQQFIEMFNEQQRRCLICKTQFEDTSKAHIDHDHGCCPPRRNGGGRNYCGNCNRGLLCSRCNKGLGHFGDSADTLEAAVSYLKERKL